MQVVLFLIFISFAVGAKEERYILPQDIIEARDQLLATKKRLDRNILNRYYKLCQQEKISEAEYFEMLAYREIAGNDCWELVFRTDI